MTGQVRMRGLREVQKNLNDEIKKIKNRTTAGLIDGARIILNSADVNEPKVPADTRNLQQSQFIVGIKEQETTGGFKGPDSGTMQANHSLVTNAAHAKVRGSRKPLVIYGFSANYAEHVHESTRMKNFNRPGSGTKFLEKAIDREKDNVLKAIAQRAKIK